MALLAQQLRFQVFKKVSLNGKKPNFFFWIEEVIDTVMMVFSWFSGFVGVYLAGYILEVSGSWAAVFTTTATVNLFGIAVFVIFGSGTPIVQWESDVFCDIVDTIIHIGYLYFGCTVFSSKNILCTNLYTI